MPKELHHKETLASFEPNLTLGIKRTPRVSVVINRIRPLIRTKPNAGSSVEMYETGTPIAQRITTLYTLIPMKRESFNAGIETLRVSKAMNRPKISRRLWKV